MPRCEYMDMVDDDGCRIQIVTRRRWRLRHGATIDCIRLDSEKMAMAVMQEGEKMRSGLRPAYRLDPEISRRDSRNAELSNQARWRRLLLGKAQLREGSEKKRRKNPVNGRRVRLRLGGLGGDKIRDGTDGFSGSIACPLAATGVIRCVELFVDASTEEGKREKKAKKAKEEELVRYDSRRGWGNKVTRWST